MSLSIRSELFRMQRQALYVVGKRECIVCRETKSILEFTPATRGANGFAAECRPCRIQNQIDRYDGLYESLRDGHKRATKAGVRADNLTAAEVLGYWASVGIDPWQCVATGEKLTQSTRNIDHVRPLSEPSSPGHVLGNVVPVSAEFNRWKANKSIVEAVAGWYDSHEPLALPVG